MFRFLLALLCAAATLPAADDLAAQMKSIVQAYSIVEQNAADAVSSEQAFYQGAIPGLLKTLDPHSVFFDPGQFEQLKKMETSTQKGFGSVVSLLPGRVIVLQTLPGTPSAKSGLMPGDDILAVNGYIVGQFDTEQITELLSQSRQRQAQLDVRRGDSSRILHFTLIPEEMQSPSVERAFFLGAGVGYIRVSSFDEHTAAELKQAIEKLGGHGLAGLVLDFRNNPGGMVAAALDMAALFLPPGAKIVTVRGRHVPGEVRSRPIHREAVHVKLAILVNEKTASASEIVAGAMQDHDRATIIGVPTLRQGPRAERLPVEREHRPRADHRALLHAQRAIDPEAARRLQIRAGRHHRAPQREEGIPHRQGPHGDGRRRHPTRLRRLSASR